MIQDIVAPPAMSPCGTSRQSASPHDGGRKRRESGHRLRRAHSAGFMSTRPSREVRAAGTGPVSTRLGECGLGSTGRTAGEVLAITGPGEPPAPKAHQRANRFRRRYAETCWERQLSAGYRGPFGAETAPRGLKGQYTCGSSDKHYLLMCHNRNSGCAGKHGACLIHS
jgi:hypothetical protein